MINLVRRLFKWKRDNNYYGGLILLQIGIGSIVPYLLYDAFEPLSFLVTFVICGWGFVLIWKSDNEYRFHVIQQKIMQLSLETKTPNLVASTISSPALAASGTQKPSRCRRRKIGFIQG